MTQKFITSLAVTACLGIGMVVGTAQPSLAQQMGDTSDRDRHTIMVNGHLFHGNWAFVRERPYVNVHALEQALGLPHHHDTRNWYLGEKGNPQGSNLQQAVESPKGKLPSVNYGGTTLVDLESVCQALHVRLHKDYEHKTYWVGHHERY